MPDMHKTSWRMADLISVVSEALSPKEKETGYRGGRNENPHKLIRFFLPPTFRDSAKILGTFSQSPAIKTTKH